MKAANEGLRFLLELVLVGAFAWFGWWLGGNPVVSVVLAVLFVAVFAVTWGLFAAPKRRFATPGWVPGAMFVGYGLLAAAALVVGGHAVWAAVLAVLVVVNEAARLAGLEVVDR